MSSLLVESGKTDMSSITDSSIAISQPLTSVTTSIESLKDETQNDTHEDHFPISFISNESGNLYLHRYYSQLSEWYSESKLPNFAPLETAFMRDEDDDFEISSNFVFDATNLNAPTDKTTEFVLMITDASNPILNDKSITTTPLFFKFLSSILMFHYSDHNENLQTKMHHLEIHSTQDRLLCYNEIDTFALHTLHNEKNPFVQKLINNEQRSSRSLFTYPNYANIIASSEQTRVNDEIAIAHTIFYREALLKRLFFYQLSQARPINNSLNNKVVPDFSSTSMFSNTRRAFNKFEHENTYKIPSSVYLKLCAYKLAQVFDCGTCHDAAIPTIDTSNVFLFSANENPSLPQNPFSESILLNVHARLEALIKTTFLSFTREVYHVDAFVDDSNGISENLKSQLPSKISTQSQFAEQILSYNFLQCSNNFEEKSTLSTNCDVSDGKSNLVKEIAAHCTLLLSELELIVFTNSNIQPSNDNGDAQINDTIAAIKENSLVNDESISLVERSHNGWQASLLVDSLYSLTTFDNTKDLIHIKKEDTIISDDDNSPYSLIVDSKTVLSEFNTKIYDTFGIFEKSIKFPRNYSYSNLRYGLSVTNSSFGFEKFLLLNIDSRILTSQGETTVNDNFSNLIAAIPLKQTLVSTKIFVSRKKTSVIAATPIFTTRLVRFIEHISNRRVLLHIEPNLFRFIDSLELSRLALGARNFNFYTRLFPTIFADEMLQVFGLALKLRDSDFLADGIRRSMLKISSGDHRLFISYIKNVLRLLIITHPHADLARGVKLTLRGKISVAGNARTRTIFIRLGYTSNSTLTNRIHYAFRTVSTFTGVLGLHIALIY